jgi:hypothetical protein
VLRPSLVASRFEALRGAALTPLIGREEEIDLLLRRWARAKAGDGQVVLVFGEPGIDKSRIAAALAGRLQAKPHIRLRHFCSAYHQDSALFPFIDQLDRAAGFTRDDTPGQNWRSSRPCWLAQHHRTRMWHSSPICCHCRVRIGTRLPNLSPQRKKERTLEALIRQLEGLARQMRPT